MPRGTLTEEQKLQRQKLLKKLAKGTVASEQIEEDVKKLREAKERVVWKTFSLYASYWNFEKADKEKRLVKWIASNEALDCYWDIVRFDAMKDAFDDYMKFWNVREMHWPSAVGTVKDYEFDNETKSTIIEAKIVDDMAWTKVLEWVYKGFSIWGKVIEAEPLMIKTYDDDWNEYEQWTGWLDITKLELIEISVVDRPANPEALIEAYKSHNAGKEEWFVPDLAFISKDIAKAKESEDCSLVKKILSPKKADDMFDKVWKNIVAHFQKDQDVNVEEMKDDEAKVSITKAELYSLVKTFVAKAVEEAEAWEEPAEETPAEEKPEENNEAETPAETEEKVEEETPETPETPEWEVVEKSEETPETETPETPAEETPKADDETPAEEKVEEEKTVENGEEVAKMITAGFEKMQSELLKKIDSQNEKISNLEKAVNEKDATINEMMKKAGFSMQIDAPAKKEESIFKWLL